MGENVLKGYYKYAKFSKTLLKSYSRHVIQRTLHVILGHITISTVFVLLLQCFWTSPYIVIQSKKTLDKIVLYLIFQNKFKTTVFDGWI